MDIFIYNICEVNLTVNKSENLTIRECIIYWEKLLTALDSRKRKEERLPIVISYGNKEQVIDVRPAASHISARVQNYDNAARFFLIKKKM